VPVPACAGLYPATTPVPSPDGALAADPPGFDRSRFLEQLGRDLSDYFDANL
jgi:hypothetical protein